MGAPKNRCGGSRPVAPNSNCTSKQNNTHILFAFCFLLSLASPLCFFRFLRRIASALRLPSPSCWPAAFSQVVTSAGIHCKRENGPGNHFKPCKASPPKPPSLRQEHQCPPSQNALQWAQVMNRNRVFDYIESTLKPSGCSESS